MKLGEARDGHPSIAYKPGFDGIDGEVEIGAGCAPRRRRRETSRVADRRQDFDGELECRRTVMSGHVGVSVARLEALDVRELVEVAVKGCQWEAGGGLSVRPARRRQNHINRGQTGRSASMTSSRSAVWIPAFGTMGEQGAYHITSALIVVSVQHVNRLGHDNARPDAKRVSCCSAFANNGGVAARHSFGSS